MSKTEELSLPDFQTYYEVFKILILAEELSNRFIKQNEEFRIRALVYDQLIFINLSKQVYEKS